MNANLTITQLNDVLSLCVGLWAVKVANRETNSKMYTYGVSWTKTATPHLEQDLTMVSGEFSGSELKR